MEYAEYTALGGTVTETDFTLLIRKANSYIRYLSSRYKVSYSDVNLSYALVELIGNYKNEDSQKEDTVAWSMDSYSEKKTHSTIINYEAERYKICQRYFDISRVARW